jgi:hypothetical protein
MMNVEVERWEEKAEGSFKTLIQPAETNVCIGMTSWD